jgi:uncharacterized protein (TIGR02996 family)
MATEAELLKAVLDDHDADAPRLAYADWCAQQPDEPTIQRAEFIRARIALSKHAQPALASGPGATQDALILGYKADEAQRQHRATWAAAIARIASSYRFDRGFIEYIALPARAFLDHADALFAQAPIRHLDLSGARPLLGELFASPWLGQLRSLGLDDCALEDADIHLLAASPYLHELRWLSLTHNRLHRAGAEVLVSAKNVPKLAYAGFLGNLFEPNEQYSFDSGYVVDAGLPADGRLLEALHGPIRWLHHAATSVSDAVPDRFRI